jgi:hypothetical protein
MKQKSERAVAHHNSQRLFNLDACDVNFAREVSLWAFQVQYEIQELVAGTERSIATSKALIAEADRLLAIGAPNPLPLRA